jgi:selenide,water dikinase
VRVVGGHSIDDNEPKFGMAVTGVVHPTKVGVGAGVWFCQSWVVVVVAGGDWKAYSDRMRGAPQVLRNVGAQVGDDLLLTKPIGTGIITTALKRGLVDHKAPPAPR